MKTRFKMLVTAVLVVGVVFGAVGQQINLNAPNIRLGVDAGNINLQPIVPVPGVIIGYSAIVNAFGIALNGSNINLNPVSGSRTTNNGNLHVTLQLTSGLPKAFVHPHPTDTSKLIRYVAIESAEALTLARGTTKTINGEAIITLPEHFAMVTSKDEPLTIHLTPKGAPVLLYVKKESNEQIVVAMRQSDFSEFRDVEFSFQVTGVRDGFEKMDTMVKIDELSKPLPMRDDVQKGIEAMNDRLRKKSEVEMKE